MKKSRVLVTGTGQLGVGEGIVQCLQMHPECYEIWAANADRNAVALYTADHSFLLPLASHPDYIASVWQVIQENKIEFLIPGSEPELRVLSKQKEALEAIGCHVLISSRASVEIGDDKFKTFEFLHQNGLPVPATSETISEDAANEIGWPIVLKPKSGGGGKHVHIARNPEELEAAIAALPLGDLPMVLQEYVGTMDTEFTASAVCMPDGRVIGAFATRRTLVGGATGTVEVEEYPEVLKCAVEVALALEATGPINIQCRMTPKGPYVFEINPRFSGSAHFRALAGFNEPHLLIQSIIAGKPVAVPPISFGVFGVRSFAQTLVPIEVRNAIEAVKLGEHRLL